MYISNRKQDLQRKREYQQEIKEIQEILKIKEIQEIQKIKETKEIQGGVAV